MTASSLWRRLCTIGAWTLVSRVLGLIRDRLFGAYFGGSLFLLDAFYVAFSLPNMFRNLFGEGALSSAFIPRYVQKRDHSEEGSDKFAGLVLTRLALFLSLIAGLGMIAASLCMLYAESDKSILVATLLITQVPYLVFICCSAIMAGVLNGRRHFVVPAASPIILNICLIAAVLLWRDIYLLPYAVLCTGFFQCAFHLIALRMTGKIPPASFKRTDAYNEMRRALLPTIVASSIFQLNALLDAIIAYAFLPEATGAVTVLYFANRLLQFPLALIAYGVGTAAYPEIASAASLGYHKSGELLRSSNRLLLALCLPAACGLFLVADPMVRCIFQTGDFSSDSANRVVLVAQIYACSLVPIAVSKILLRSFHAHRNQHTPMIIALIGIVINLLLNIIFIVSTNWNEAGLAAASAISAFIMCFIYIIKLKHSGSGHVIEWRNVPYVLFSTFIMGIVVFFVSKMWQISTDSSSLAHGMRLMVVVLVGCFVYAICMVKKINFWRRQSANTQQ
ncbi:MAG: murein biosynthesis integral membrane protein MurJ [Planctomycetes bacterium]|nr:murein biosynthesis integral membrane protein MurJ [Planctomycetota bacterium]